MEATNYVLKRQGDAASKGTINGELTVLNRILYLNYENGKLLRLPVIRQLKEAARRQAFFEREQFGPVLRHPAKDLQVAVPPVYTYGWQI